jgi:tRNA (guanine37-N1)-methyltransferase
LKFDILTLFPRLFTPFYEEGVFGRAVKKGLVDIHLIDIRSFARGTHKVTDDRPYGGGNGMVMKPGPISRALRAIERVNGQSIVILLTPQGRTFDQSMAWELSRLDQLILICGRYEGVDERIRLGYVDMELSIGDFILSGGELGAMMVVDAVSRLVPGVLGGEHSNLEDTFEQGLMEYPQYTRPRVFEGMEVPGVLLSGDHEKIRIWRRMEAIKRTLEKRPDLLKRAELSQEERDFLIREQERTDSKNPLPGSGF